MERLNLFYVEWELGQKKVLLSANQHPQDTTQQVPLKRQRHVSMATIIQNGINRKLLLWQKSYDIMGDLNFYDLYWEFQ